MISAMIIQKISLSAFSVTLKFIPSPPLPVFST